MKKSKLTTDAVSEARWMIRTIKDQNARVEAAKSVPGVIKYFKLVTLGWHDWEIMFNYLINCGYDISNLEDFISPDE